ncbi:copper resistance protein CopC [Jannaschia sp. R86511]|uniref:copper resistance protein CopC n=1 Tax=Jannaschia sp. R86511 TaxID=3093853 RepID=UPI0036D361E1
MTAPRTETTAGTRPAGRWPGAVAATLLLALVAVVAGAAPASAHARFLGSDPEEDTTVTALPDVVTMSYNEEIAPQFVDTAVVPPGGEPIVTGSAAEGTDVLIDLAASADLADLATTSGEWQVVARVVSVDGHPVEHTTSFVLDAPEPSVAPEPSPAAEPTPEPSPAAESAPVAEATPEAAATSAAPSPPSPEATTIAADTTAGTSDGLPTWVTVAGVVVLALLAAVGVVVYRRRQGASD